MFWLHFALNSFQILSNFPIHPNTHFLSFSPQLESKQAFKNNNNKIELKLTNQNKTNQMNMKK